MSTTLSATAYAPSTLPDVLPIFPLAGVILLPRARLPLNIFEPRYLSMVEDTLATSGRLVGIIQPHMPEGLSGVAPPVYSVGCAGRITSFDETDDGRYLIGLTGVVRFEVKEELPLEQLYRRVRPCWEKYGDDQTQPDETSFDRDKLLPVLQNYFRLKQIEADWKAIQNTPGELLISSLAMICPLEPNEKQALLEAVGLKERAALLTSLLEMATAGGDDSDVKH